MLRERHIGLIAVLVIALLVVGLVLSSAPDTEVIDQYDDSTFVAQRTGINLISGSNITVTSSDSPANNRVDFTITGSGAGSGTLTTIKEGGTPVGDPDIVTLDFGAGFDLTESPDTEINVAFDITEISLTDDNAWVGSSGGAPAEEAIPDCDDAGGNHLNYDTATNAFSCGTSISAVDISDDTNLTCGTNCTLTDDEISVDDSFLANDGDIGTGVYDFGGATSFEVPNSAGGGTIDTAGEIGVDTTAATQNFHDGSAERVLDPVRKFAFTIEDPTNAEDISVKRTDIAFTIVRQNCVLVGSDTPSVTITLRHGTDRSAAGAELNTSGDAITSTTTGDEDTSFDDPTVIADSYLWLETTAQSGTVDELHCTYEYQIDA